MEARDAALEALYATDLDGDPQTRDLGEKARRLAAGVRTHEAAIDNVINTYAEGWKTDRMPAVDRAILRLGTYELTYEPETPPAVVMAEAVRLANAYSTERSGRFVNGVLAKIAESTSGAKP